jgi:hypothetical protein
MTIITDRCSRWRQPSAVAFSHSNEEEIMITEFENITLDPEEDNFLFQPGDWTRQGQVMFHMPTHLAFIVSIPEDLPPRHNLSVFDFFARLGHVCAGHAMPSDYVSLGRAAIIVFLLQIGFLAGAVIEEVTEPLYLNS